MSDPNRDNMGQQHGSAHDAKMANQLNVGAEGATGGFAGGAGGPFLMIAAIGPVIAAAIGGFIFGILFKLGTFGRTLQSAIVGLVVGILTFIAVDTAGKGFFGLNFIFEPVNVRTPMIGIVIVCAVLFTMWYFQSLYPIFKSMGVLVFSMLVKNTFCFGWFGLIGGTIIGFFKKTASTPIIIGSLILGAVYFVIKIISFAGEGKEEKAALPKAIIAEIISVALVATVFVLFNMGTGRSNADSIASRQVRGENRKEITNAAKNAARQGVPVIAIGDVMEKDPSTGEFKEGSTIVDQPGMSGTIIKIVEEGKTLTMTGEVVSAKIHGTLQFYAPVEFEDVKGFINVNYINLKEGN